MGRTREPRWRVALIVLGMAGTQSCFLYDSRWGETKRAQQSNARHATPGALRATPATAEASTAEAPSRSVRVLKVRVHATPRYAAEVLDWPRRLAELVDDANAVLAPTLDAQIELLILTSSWVPQAGEEDLTKLVDDLQATDPGQDVDRVIGLVGSVPRYELSFHQLGMGKVFGKQLVMRAMNDAREYEAIRRGFSELEEKERTKLYAARKRHKTTTVFLHELGHTFGVPHEVDRQTVMHASYDPKVEGYSAAAAQLMRLTLAHEVAPSAQSPETFARAVIDHLERTSAGWVDADRDALIARLGRAPPAERHAPPGAAHAAAARPTATAAAAAAPAAQSAPASLSATDRTTFEQAQAHLRSGRVADAWSTAKPLFAAYPAEYAVQDLRCQIAMKRGLVWQEVQSECEALMRLVPGAR